MEKRMKRLGLIGGMSPSSTEHYYSLINGIISRRLGGNASAEIIVDSVNFADITSAMDKDDWAHIRFMVYREAELLVDQMGCDYVAIATNTIHRIADDLPACIQDWSGGRAQFVHIGDCIVDRCRSLNVSRVLNLGTKFTMAQPFMSEYLKRQGINVCSLEPIITQEDVEEIHRIIFDELCHNTVNPSSTTFLKRLIWHYLQECHEHNLPAPEGVVLGCTELNMILKGADSPIYVIDSTYEHAATLARLCMSAI